jgi:peptidoglycan hydrolase-like protein with peptidoglycan-binding domain
MLQSQLFGGDPKLEAAAVSDSAHIVQGARGEHVQKIQLALISIDDAAIAADGLYGPATAAAVLAYKKKRGIINLSYQTQTDNIVGKMTIAALDREILDLERPPTGRLCRLTSSEIKGPSGTRPQLGFALSSGLIAVSAALSPRDQALVRVPIGSLLVTSAQSGLRRVADVIRQKDPDKIVLMKRSSDWQALLTHFHVDDSTVDRVVRFASPVFLNIAQTLLSANRLFVNGPPSATFFGQAHLGGTHFRNDPRFGRIEFGREYLKLGGAFQTAVIIHEAAHFANSTIDHMASELPSPQGSPVDGALHHGNTKDYSSLTADESLVNAYSYAQFALHTFLGFDKRLHFKRLPDGSIESE